MSTNPSRSRTDFLAAMRREEQAAKIHGWDFSHIAGRYAESPLPWDFARIVRAHLHPGDRVLDIDTGGGEFLRSLAHPLTLCAASEAYPPNAALCRAVLTPLGVDFREASARALPWSDGAFERVIDRHGDFDAPEICRVLKPGGLFLTQQVGADNDRALVELLLGDIERPYPEATLPIAREKFERAGFAILRAEECCVPIRFYDAGALAWFARIIEWEFPGFSVERCLPRLEEAAARIARDGFVEGQAHRYLLIARKA